MKVIITGGAGFIGSNAAARHLARGNEVVVLDNLSRRGAERNWSWLQQQREGAPAAGALTLARADLRASEAVDAVFAAHADAEMVLHLGGQVAVTTSVVNPREDFEINALGTFNVLEAARRLPRLRALLYASTNKVYGGMEDVGIVEHGGRYAYASLPQGVSETQQLDFHSPYGCSYSADTDILTRDGWKRFYDLSPEDEVLTYNLDRRVAEFQRPTAHFAFPYVGQDVRPGEPAPEDLRHAQPQDAGVLGLHPHRVAAAAPGGGAGDRRKAGGLPPRGRGRGRNGRRHVHPPGR